MGTQMWYHGPARPWCRCGSLLIHLPPPGSNLEETREEDVLIFLGGTMPTGECPIHCTHAGAPGTLHAAPLFQVCCVREEESTNKRKLNMKSEFVYFLRNLGVAEWNCIHKNSGYQMLDTCRNTCTVGPSQNSADSLKEKSKMCLGSVWLQKKALLFSIWLYFNSLRFCY